MFQQRCWRWFIQLSGTIQRCFENYADSSFINKVIRRQRRMSVISGGILREGKCASFLPRKEEKLRKVSRDPEEEGETDGRTLDRRAQDFVRHRVCRRASRVFECRTSVWTWNSSLPKRSWKEYRWMLCFECRDGTTTVTKPRRFLHEEEEAIPHRHISRDLRMRNSRDELKVALAKSATLPTRSCTSP